jgi:hypothetical protein
MKHLIALLLVFTASSIAFAQTRVKASDIIRQINSGQAVAYADVEIEGDLDLTDLHNSRQEKGSSFFYFGSTETFESTVNVPLKFTRCTFLGEVLAYYHLERRNETYVAHFKRDVAFTDCTFRKGSEFKYSEFHGVTTFAGSTFHREANFKYAEFSSGPSFSLARFDEGANFKYAEFPRETSFEKAVFNGRTDFKYTKFRSPLNMEGVAFRGSEDFKYTKIDGRSFTAYLLNR